MTVQADAIESVPRNRRTLRPPTDAAVWGLTAALLTTGLLLFFLRVQNLQPVRTSLHISWWTLALAFAACEILVVHLQYRGDAQTFSLSEVPLVLGLCFANPAALLLGRLVGAAGALIIYRRQSGLKLAFNLSQFLLFDGCLASLIFHTIIGRHAPVQSIGWLAVFATVVSIDLLAGCTIALATRLHEGSLPRRVVGQQILFGGMVAIVNTSLALVAVLLLWYDAPSVTLLLVVGAVLFVAYRGHATLQRVHDRLQSLYSFSHATCGAASLQQASRAILEQARQVMAAEVAELAIADDDSGEPLTRFRSVAGKEMTVEQVATASGLGPLTQRVFQTQTSVLCRRPLTRADERADLLARGIEDAVIAPLRFGEVTYGTLLVGNRLGSVTTFDEEDLQALETLANHAGGSVVSGRLLDRLRVQIATREYEALHDGLTGLPNRTLFVQRLNEAIADAEGTGRLLTVLVLDLNDFKDINDTLGHDTGDVLLCQTAQRLLALARPGDVVARLGGDEFALLANGLESPTEARTIAYRVAAAISEVVNVEDLALQVRASIGAALCPRDATAPQRLLQRAEMSMHAAKSAHRGVEFFRHEHDRSSPRRLTVIGELRRTLDGRGMSLEFQPQVSLSSGTVVAVESLARWDHLSLGSIRPDEFIPLAEHTGMIRALTQNVVEHTLRQALTWSDAGIELRYSINLSARSLLDVDLIDQVEMMLARSHLHPSCFSFEVTESSIMADPVGALAVLRKLASYGVRLSIDDYGTGHSSLAYLRRLPASEVKIGKEFIVDIVTDPRASAIVKSTIDLGHDLGLEIVAEGVEDEATLRLLKKLGCDLAQGYHVGRPQPAEQFERWLWTNGAWRPRQREDAHNGEPVAEERQGSVISIDKIRRRPG